MEALFEIRVFLLLYGLPTMAELHLPISKNELHSTGYLAHKANYNQENLDCWVSLRNCTHGEGMAAIFGAICLGSSLGIPIIWLTDTLLLSFFMNTFLMSSRM